MRALSDQDHYEILETRSDASGEEIERCYRMMLATYADDSLAGYSVVEEGDSKALRERIEVAYQVLSDRELRRQYDAELGLSEPDHDPSLGGVIAAAAPSLEPTLLANPPALPARGFGEVDDGSGDFDGTRLRRYRIRCGLEIEDIAGVTKISPTYLRFIEEEQYPDLPASVYVRGFVTAYASCLGLDSKRVAASYMKRFEEGRGGRHKGRFFDAR